MSETPLSHGPGTGNASVNHDAILLRSSGHKRPLEATDPRHVAKTKAHKVYLQWQQNAPPMQVPLYSNDDYPNQTLPNGRENRAAKPKRKAKKQARSELDSPPLREPVPWAEIIANAITSTTPHEGSQTQSSSQAIKQAQASSGIPISHRFSPAIAVELPSYPPTRLESLSVEPGVAPHIQQPPYTATFGPHYGSGPLSAEASAFHQIPQHSADSHFIRPHYSPLQDLRQAYAVVPPNVPRPQNYEDSASRQPCDAAQPLAGPGLQQTIAMGAPEPNPVDNRVDASSSRGEAMVRSTTPAVQSMNPAALVIASAPTDLVHIPASTVVHHQETSPRDADRTNRPPPRDVAQVPQSIATLSPGIIRIMQRLYSQSDAHPLTEADAMSIWEGLSLSDRECIGRLYMNTSRAAQLQRQASDAAFSRTPTQLVWQKDRPASVCSTTTSGLSRHPTSQSVGEPGAGRPLLLSQFPSQSMSQSSILSSDTVQDLSTPTPTQSRAATEAVVDAPRSNPAPYTRADKGKGRAPSRKDSERSDSSMSSVTERHPVAGGSHPHWSAQDAGGADGLQLQYHNNEAGNLSAQIGAVVLRKLDHVCDTLHAHAEMMKTMLENNQRFQDALMGALPSATGACSWIPANNARTPGPSSVPARRKATATRGADLQVEQKVAKARGNVEPPSSAVQEQLAVNRFRARVRNHLNTLLHLVDPELLPVQFPPLTEDEVEAFKHGTLDCTPENFRIDFDKGWKKFPFNKRARQVAILSFQRLADGGAFVSNPTPNHLLTSESIGSVLDVYVKRLRRLYKEALSPPSKEKKEEIQRRACQVARMHTSYRDRRFVVVYLGLSRHKILFERLSAANMSEDETDGETVQHPPVYRIVIAQWQSDELKTFLWALDSLYRQYWAKPPGQRRKGGNPPRTRVLREHCHTRPGVAPAGLWENCYNPRWLETLMPWEREALDIQEGNYDFSIDGANIHA